MQWARLLWIEFQGKQFYITKIIDFKTMWWLRHVAKTLLIIKCLTALKELIISAHCYLETSDIHKAVISELMIKA